MGNTFNRTYSKRRSTFNFGLTKDFDMDAFKTVIELFPSNMPSKQDRFPYQIDILDWSDKALRKDIMYGTMPDAFPGQKCIYNNQVLAPVLVCFTYRYNDPHRYVAPEEIGMAVMSLTYLLQSNGFLTSFCQCIQDSDNLGKRITGEDNTTLNMILPVGQHAYTKHRTMPNPFEEEELHLKTNPIHQNTPNIKYQIDTRK